MSIKDVLFRLDDEVEFKRQFVIQFLASYQAVRYDPESRFKLGACVQKQAIEDAKTLADDAWKKWIEVIGVVGPLRAGG